MNNGGSRRAPQGPSALLLGAGSLVTPGKARLAWVICLAAPWLNPFAGGPSASVNPWLFAALCTTLAGAVQPYGRLHTAVPLALAGLGAWTFLATGYAPDALALAAACLVIFMAAAMAAGHLQRPKRVDAIALAWALAATLSTAIALLQYFDAARPLAPWVNASATGEAFANLRQRNQFASLTVIGMASVLWLARHPRWRWLAVAAMAWLALGNAATTSRTGLVQMLLLGALLILWPAPRAQRLPLWLVAILAYGAATLVLPWLLEMSGGEPGKRLWDRVAAVDACSSRMVLWSNVLHLIAQKPWLGWGWGNLDFAHYMTLYPGERFCDILDNAHSLPLHLAVELGVPAALLVCGGLLWAVVRARPWQEADAARQLAWAVLAVIAVHSLLEYPLWYGPFQVAFGLCLGLLWAAPLRVAAGGAPSARVSALSLVLLAAAAAACAYAAWDYRRVSQIYLPLEARAPGYRDATMRKAGESHLFRHQAGFAELTLTPLTPANAQWTFELAAAMLHYSPEPRVIEKLIESAIVLGRDDEALLHVARYRAAFPEDHAKWSASRSEGAAPRRPAGSQPAT